MRKSSHITKYDYEFIQTLVSHQCNYHINGNQRIPQMRNIRIDFTTVINTLMNIFI